jgi:hypothetical protein
LRLKEDFTRRAQGSDLKFSQFFTSFFQIIKIFELKPPRQLIAIISFFINFLASGAAN